MSIAWNLKRLFDLQQHGPFLHSLGTALEWCKISSHQSFPAEAKLKVFNRAVLRPFSYRIAFPMYLSTFDQVLSESSPVHCWQTLQVLKSSSCAPTIFSAHVFPGARSSVGMSATLTPTRFLFFWLSSKFTGSHTDTAFRHTPDTHSRLTVSLCPSESRPLTQWDGASPFSCRQM